jgi:hypothetical protein
MKVKELIIAVFLEFRIGIWIRIQNVLYCKAETHQ